MIFDAESQISVCRAAWAADQCVIGAVRIVPSRPLGNAPAIQISVCRAAWAASQCGPKRCAESKMISRYDKSCFESGRYV